MKTSVLLVTGLLGAAILSARVARGDVVTEWNAHLEEAVFATAQPVPAQPRSAAIVHLAIFDAVNGIQRRYAPYHVTDYAPRGARVEAAAIQAAYTTLVALYPGHAAVLDSHLSDSLARLPGNQGKSQSISRGRAWGRFVAEKILALRSHDGWSDPQPPFMGGEAIGQWRSTPTATNPDGTLPAVFPQLAVLQPFVMDNPAAFRPGPPYGATIPNALLSPAYAVDFAETKDLGRLDSPYRTAEQTTVARLWQAMGGIDEMRAVRGLVSPRARLVDNARLFALMSMVACDALIIGWDSKFDYQLWRPHHAIRLADLDGNPATEADPEWTSLIPAPRFPEYVSNHSTLTASILRVAQRELGDEHTFTLGTPLMPGVTRTYARFSDAVAEVVEARIWGGIHFRHACNVGNELGIALADLALRTRLTPLAED